MNLLQAFKANWQKHFSQLSTVNSHLLLAVSGGMDSIVLVDLISKAGFDFTIAHCNFQLRATESLRDENFVRTLGEKYGKEVFTKQFDTQLFATNNKISIQEAARKLRYDWFNELISSKFKIPNSKLLTAHHADDNIETLLFNFFRGTGISGLHGILPKQGNIVRPLLFAKREAIVAYAKENNLSWVEDSSNALDKYSRNYIRHQVVPMMKTIFASVEDNLLNNIERMGEAEMLYNQAVQLHKIKLLEQKGIEIHIPVLKLKQAVPLQTIVWEIIKDFGFTANQSTEVIKLLDAENGSFIKSLTHRIILNRKWLIIATLQTEVAKHIIIEEEEKKVAFEKGELLLEDLSVTGYKLQDEKNIAAFDADAISFPLLLRKAKMGDYFYPLGMPKKKKLSKFFIDQKLSKTAKENVWVLESNKKIVWVIGLRIDDRAKIKPSTKNVLRVSLQAI
ncbi:MAG: tRNA lysidine(34) synthetase TilS [Chitinophagaceae bacterium]|nr:tRNA lysidine(34) synthetase TilS [Chitinophagaceae bacterium]